MITRQTPTAATLSNLYEVIRDNVCDLECYYTEEQTKELKRDKTKIFLRKENPET